MKLTLRPEKAGASQPVFFTPDRMIVGLLMLAMFALFPSAILHLDLARDLAIAYDMRANDQWRLLGPQLAGVFNLGPVWYYLLSGLQSLGLGVAGISLVLSLLAALRIPLIFHAGRLWADRRSGLIWAVLLLIPAWHTFELVLLSVPTLTLTLLAATFLFGWRFADRGRTRDLIWMGLFYSLALHAHPSVLMIIAMPAGFLILAWARHGVRAGPLLSAVGVALIPFLPFLMYQQLNGWTLFENIGQFQSSQAGAFSFSQLAKLAWEIGAGGLEHWLSRVAGFPEHISRAMSLGFAALCCVGLVGAAMRSFHGDRVAWILFTALASGLVGLLMLRAIHPFYMLAPIWFVFSGLVAVGLAYWSRKWRRLKPLVTAMLLFAVLLYLAVGFRSFEQQEEGSWPFAWFPLMDVKQADMEHRGHAFLSAYEARRSGRWLCRNQGLTVHGPYGLSLLHSFAIESLLHCGQARLTVAGPVRDGIHVAGLPRAMLAEIDLDPVATVGPFDIFNVVSVPRQQPGIALETFRSYPPLPVSFNAFEVETLDLSEHRGRYLVITHIGFALSPRPEMSLSCADQPIEPLATDNVTWLFSLPACDADLTFDIRATNPDHVDVAVF